jgi:hypothetical protein
MVLGLCRADPNLNVGEKRRAGVVMNVQLLIHPNLQVGVSGFETN